MMRTGIYLDKTKSDVHVYWRGQKVMSYPSMDAFIAAHLEALDALDRHQEALLEDEYQP
ncbi:MAG: hypothetical protein ACPG9T_01940 [Pseudomonadales bacterium]